MSTSETWRKAIEQTGKDAQRFRWIAEHPAIAEVFIETAVKLAESEADVLALLREAIDVKLSVAEAARLAEWKAAQA